MNALVDPLMKVHLNAGEFFFGEGDTRVSTLLGSCVSITLWHPRRRMGGMCHFMLTERIRPTNAALDGRYGREAFELFLRQVRTAGTHPGEYQAKLFGGANMLSQLSNGASAIGTQNIEYGRQLLASSRIALVAEHVGGSGRRKLHFDLPSGEVWLAFPQGSDAHIRSFYG